MESAQPFSVVTHSEFPQTTHQQFNCNPQNGIPHMPYGIIPYPKPMANITLPGGTAVSMPAELLNKAICDLTKTAQRTQENNVIVALSVLQSALTALLGLKAAFESLLSKGDDNTLLTNLNKCIAELKQANAPQQAAINNPLAWLVTDEKTSITDARELFEHCIKVIQEFIPCLTGRSSYSSHEFIFQTFGWRGWKQQATQIAVSNAALAKLLDKLQEDEPENGVFNEVRCFSEAVDSIVQGFFKQLYPVAARIGKIYALRNVHHCFFVDDPFLIDPNDDVPFRKQAEKAMKRPIIKTEKK